MIPSSGLRCRNGATTESAGIKATHYPLDGQDGEMSIPPGSTIVVVALRATKRGEDGSEFQDPSSLVQQSATRTCILGKGKAPSHCPYSLNASRAAPMPWQE
jgi:hypothetical protein